MPKSRQSRAMGHFVFMIMKFFLNDGLAGILMPKTVKMAGKNTVWLLNIRQSGQTSLQPIMPVHKRWIRAIFAPPFHLLTLSPLSQKVCRAGCSKQNKKRWKSTWMTAFMVPLPRSELGRRWRVTSSRWGGSRYHRQDDECLRQNGIRRNLRRGGERTLRMPVAAV